jgi:TonB family protein
MIYILQRNSFLLALLLHFLLFSGITYTGFLQPLPLPPRQEMPALDIPAYVTHPAEQNSAAFEQQSQSQAVQKEVPTSKIGIEKPVVTEKHVLPKADQFQEVKTGQSVEDPVHLIGDKKISKSLIVLLGKAITAHLNYPKTAMDLNVRGTSYIGFTVYPDGHVSGIQILKTSTADVLDQAAYSAVNAISPVKHVDTYIQKPEFIVFGIIFG